MLTLTSPSTASAPAHTPVMDARLETVSGTCAVYVVIDRGNPDWNPKVPSRAVWSYAYPNQGWDDEQDFLRAQARLMFRRLDVEHRIGRDCKEMLAPLAAMGAIWRVVEDGPDEHGLVSCWVEVYVPIQTARSTDLITTTHRGQCYAAPALLSEYGKARS